MKLHLPKQLFTALLTVITLAAAPAAWGEGSWAIDNRTSNHIYYYSDGVQNETITTLTLPNGSNNVSVNTNGISLAADAYTNLFICSGYGGNDMPADFTGQTTTIGKVVAGDGVSLTVAENPWQNWKYYSSLLIEELEYGSGEGAGVLNVCDAESTVIVNKVSGTLSSVTNAGTLMLGTNASGDSAASSITVSNITNTGTLTLTNAVLSGTITNSNVFNLGGTNTIAADATVVLAGSGSTSQTGTISGGAGSILQIKGQPAEGSTGVVFNGDVTVGAVKLVGVNDNGLDARMPVSFYGNLTADTLYTRCGDFVFGNGTSAGKAILGRVELGDADSSGLAEHTVAINSGYTVVVTGSNNNNAAYKNVSLLMGEWNQKTKLDIDGTLVTTNGAKLLLGDWGGYVNINNGGTLAVAGIARGNTGKNTNLSLQLSEGGRLILGAGGIDVGGTGQKSINLNGGTLGVSTGNNVTVNNDVTLGGAVTFNTTQYVIGADGTIADGTGAGSLTLTNVINNSAGNRITVSGSGTLTINSLSVSETLAFTGATVDNLTIGSVQVSETHSLTPQGEGVDFYYSDNAELSSTTNGYRVETGTYVLFEGYEWTNASGTLGAYTLKKEEGNTYITVKAGVGSVYYINSGAASYDAAGGETTASAAGFVLSNNTTLTLTGTTTAQLTNKVTIAAGDGGKATYSIANGVEQTYASLGLGSLINVESGSYVLDISGDGTVVKTDHSGGSSSHGFHAGEVSITNGGKLVLQAVDGLGWEGGATPKLSILNATLALGARQTFSTDLDMQGGAVIEATETTQTGNNVPKIDVWKNMDWTVSGEGNVVREDVAVKLRENVTITVEEGGDLSIMGAYDTQQVGKITKSGEGKLILAGVAKNLDTGINLTAGTLQLGGTAESDGMVIVAGINQTGGTVDVAGQAELSGDSVLGGTFNVLATGVLTLNAATDVTGSFVVAGGKIIVGSSLTPVADSVVPEAGVNGWSSSNVCLLTTSGSGTVTGLDRVWADGVEVNVTSSLNAETGVTSYFASKNMDYYVQDIATKAEYSRESGLTEARKIYMTDGTTLVVKETLSTNKLNITGKVNYEVDGAILNLDGGTKTDISTVSVTNGGTLYLTGASANLGTSDSYVVINLSSGGKFAFDNGNGSGARIYADVAVDGTGELIGSYYGNSATIYGTVSGTDGSELKLMPRAESTNSWTIAGRIEGNMAVTSSSYVTLSGANTYSGGTTITGGRVTAANASALGTGKVTMNGGELTLNSGLTVAAMDYNGGTVNNNNQRLTVTGALIAAADMSIAGAGGTSIGTLDLSAGTTLTLGDGSASSSHTIENLVGSESSKVSLAANALLNKVNGVTGSVKLTGSGTYDAGSSHGMTANMSLATDWTGTVKIHDVTTNADIKLNDLGVTGSRVDINNVQGYFEQADNGIIYNPDINLSGNLTITNGYSNSSYTFGGKISGSGTLSLERTGGSPNTFYFTKDISSWTGALTHSAQTDNIHLTEAAKTVNAAITNTGGTLNLTVNTTDAATFSKNVTVSTLDLAQTASFSAGLTTSGNVTIDSGKNIKLAGSNTIGGLLQGAGSNTLYITANGTEVNFNGAGNHIITNIDPTSYTGITYNVKNGATLKVTGSMWMQNSSICLEEGASFNKSDDILVTGTGANSTISRQADGKTSILTPDNAAYTISNAEVEMTHSADSELKMKLTESSLTSSGSSLLTVYNAGNTITSLAANGGNVKLSESMSVQSISAKAGKAVTVANGKTISMAGGVSLSANGADATMTAKNDDALVQLAQDASFTIQDMTLTNTTITAATTETRVNLSNVSGDATLAKGKFHMQGQLPVALVNAGGSPVEFSSSALSGLTLNTADSSASLVVDLGDLSCLTPMGPGKYDLTITLSGFTMGDYSGLATGAGLVFAADSWLGSLLNQAQNANVQMTIAQAEAGAAAAAEGGSASGVSYSTGNVGTIITITGLNVPEPTTATLSLLALAALAARRRRND